MEGGMEGGREGREPDPEILRQRWRFEFTHKILPALADFKPTLLLISAGFDGHREDPIGGKVAGLKEEDFRWAAEVCRRECSKVVSVLEGGYSDEALPPACCAWVDGLIAAV